MAAAYASIPAPASPDEETREHSSQASSSTSASPTPFRSLAGATFTPLSMSVGSSDMQYPPDLLDPSDRKSADSAAKKLQETRAPDVEGVVLNTAAAQATATAPATGETITKGDWNATGDSESASPAAAPVAKPRGGEARNEQLLADAAMEEKSEDERGQTREEDGAEITSISRTTGHDHGGHAGSTPLGIPALLNFSSSSAASRGHTSRHGHLPADAPSAGGTSSKLELDSSSSSPLPPPLDTTIPSTSSPASPSTLPSPTSLIDQLQEALHRSPSQSTSPSATDGGATLHRPQPIVRTTSDSTKFTVRHPVPDLNHRSGAYVGNIAVLEKTAERLSMTSSIEDAIRDLHGELKRSDSRRSSILAASVRGDTTSPDDSVAAQNQPTTATAATPGPSLARHVSSASNIVEVNNAARNGGYSPAAYIMSPNHSLTSRLRSGSKNSTGRPDFDVDVFMSRQGPGKGSTHSVRSTKLSLAEIAESEPTALNSDAMDKADKLSVKSNGDATIAPRDQPQNAEPDTPTTDAFHQMLDQGALERPSVDAGDDYDRNYRTSEWDAPHEQHQQEQYDQHRQQESQQAEDDRPATPRSTITFDATNAFGDFDGVHCEPDFDFADMPEPQMPEPRTDMAPPRRPSERPQSYFDPGTGQQMLYYPARVPAMLNLPPKLSRKPKAAARNARHSRVLQAMGHPGLGQPEYMSRHSQAPPVRESTMWLPEPVESEAFSPFAQDALPPVEQRQPYEDDRTPAAEHRDPMEHHESQAPGPDIQGMPQPPPPARQRSPRTESGDWQHQQDVPAHLRASAFFDLPSTTPQIDAKGGSAMDALDDILNASASAPVDAFTDHVFAGKLGNEVYGRAKKKNRKSTATMLQVDDGPVVTKKRSSILPFGKAHNEDEQRRNTITNASVRSSRGRERGDEEESQALSGSIDGEGRRDGDEGSDEEDEDEAYQGAPTTLLAELQLRKQQQKQRTKNLHQALPGGQMQSTLLELDAVAEAQRKNRRTRRVNLAWEDPAAAGHDEDSDDEDVPLGVLYASKANGNNDISAAVAELNRPIGLMERREMEDNEPLSSRRARLTGQEPITLANRRSMMSLNPNMRSATRLSNFPPAPRSPTMLNVDLNTPPAREEDNVEPEVEEESLGDRMRRLRAKEESEHNNLPRARPVSSTFSNELLSQFGDLDDKTGGKDGRKTDTPPPMGEEQEETLGQRRKRLQDEREARLREMSMNALTGGAARPQVRRRLSLADTLGAHPVREQQEATAMENERRMLEEQRRVREQEAKMAAMRAQMPQTLNVPTAGTRAGGFRGGSYNDGVGGGYGGHADMNRASVAYSGYGMPNGYATPGYGQGYAGAPMQMGMGMQQMGMPQMGMQQMGMQQMGMPQMGGMPMNMNMNMGMNMGMPMQMQMPMQMPMAGQRGPADSIERWRQSVMP